MSPFIIRSSVATLIIIYCRDFVVCTEKNNMPRKSPSTRGRCKQRSPSPPRARGATSPRRKSSPALSKRVNSPRSRSPPPTSKRVTTHRRSSSPSGRVTNRRYRSPPAPVRQQQSRQPRKINIQIEHGNGKAKREFSKRSYTRKISSPPVENLTPSEASPPITRSIRKMNTSSVKYKQNFEGDNSETIIPMMAAEIPLKLSQQAQQQPNISSPAQTLWKYLNSM